MRRVSSQDESTLYHTHGQQRNKTKAIETASSRRDSLPSLARIVHFIYLAFYKEYGIIGAC